MRNLMVSTAVGIGTGLMIGLLASFLTFERFAQAQPRLEEHEACTPELVADYEAREELIFELMQYLHECRQRFHGCEPPYSRWTEQEVREGFQALHPQYGQDEAADQQWLRETFAE